MLSKSSRIVKDEQDPSFQLELDFLVKLNHPHIVQLIGYCIDCFRTSTVLEWLLNDPRKLIEYQKGTQKTRQPLSQFEAKALIIRIAKGLALCIVNICSIGI
jgi:serine/threonine protein kinase